MLKIAQRIVSALRQDEDLQVLLGATAQEEGGTLSGARIFTIAYPEVDEGKDKVPYLVVMPQGSTFEGTEDDAYMEETTNIDILCVATDISQLATIEEAVIADIDAYLEGTEEFDFTQQPTRTTSAAQMDTDKPCVFFTVSYSLNHIKS